MTEEQLIEFLKENLTIHINECSGYIYGGMGQQVHVTIKLADEEICSDYYQLPSKD